MSGFQENFIHHHQDFPHPPCWGLSFSISWYKKILGRKTREEITANLLCSWTGKFPFHILYWHFVVLLSRRKEILSYLCISKRENSNLLAKSCFKISQIYHRSWVATCPLRTERIPTSQISSAHNLWSHLGFFMLVGYFRGRNLGSKAFPTIEHRQHQLTGYSQNWPNDCASGLERRRTRFSRHYHCARGFKDSKENSWSV